MTPERREEFESNLTLVMSGLKGIILTVFDEWVAQNAFSSNSGSEDREPALASQADLVSVKRAAEILASTPATIYARVRSGQLPCRRIGSSLRFDVAEILDWAKEQTEKKQARRQRSTSSSTRQRLSIVGQR